MSGYETYVICNVCGENLGEDRPYWGVGHLKKYPTHKSYREARKHSTDKQLSPQDEEKLAKMRKAIGSVRR